MWQLQSLAKLCRTCPCPSHDEVIEEDLGLAAVTEGERVDLVSGGDIALLEKHLRELYLRNLGDFCFA